jgi:chromate reductase
VRILGIPGSVRAGSLNLSLLEAAAERARPGAVLSIYRQPRLAMVPSFDPDADPPPAVDELREAVADADALLFATPEYNGSLPGGLKNAIDWIAAPSRQGPLRGKPAAVVGADRDEVGCDWAHADTRKVLEMAGARVIGAELSIEDSERVLDGGAPGLDPERSKKLERVLDELIAEGRAPG